MKGGSEAQFATSLQLDPLDPVDQLDRLACSKLVFRVHETLLFALETHKSQYCVFKKYKVYYGNGGWRSEESLPPSSPPPPSSSSLSTPKSRVFGEIIFLRFLTHMRATDALLK